MARKHMKKCSTFLAIKEFKSNICQDFTSLLLEWLSSRTQATTDDDKDVGKSNPHTLLVGM
jgi:hypothetical protein